MEAADPTTVRCPRCGADPGDDCVFVKARRAGARRGEWMGGSSHAARYDAAKEETP